MTKTCSKSLLAIIFFLVTGTAAANVLVMSAPPRETPEVGMQLYGPIAELISKVTGTNVTYQHPGNWLKYQREMREGKYDIVFDGPHFISWRIEHVGHEVIVRIPGNLQFHLVSLKDNEKIGSPNDLIGKSICGISPPNLSTLSVLDIYRNPVRQPVIKGVKGGMPKVFKAFDNGRNCDAVVLRTDYFNKKMKAEEKEGLKILFTSKVMPNQGISVSNKLDSRLKKNIQKALTSAEGAAVSEGILKRFAGKAKNFLPTDNKEYAGYNQLLEGVIFGW